MIVNSPSGVFHFHVCEWCAHCWGHEAKEVSKEERRRIHTCEKCGCGPYITAYTTRRDASEVQQHVRSKQ